MYTHYFKTILKQTLRNYAAAQVLVRYIRYVLNRIGRIIEIKRYVFVAPQGEQFFFIACCGRNAGESAIKCLDSTYAQRYSRSRFHVLYIDDASTDGTRHLIRRWLSEHPDHNVQFVQNIKRKGGTANTQQAFRMAPSGSVVVELNGDDWLADPYVLRFFNKVYSDDDVWVTYNTCTYSNRRPRTRNSPIPKRVINMNAVRDSRWYSGNPRTFRRELLEYVGYDSWIDPATGDYWYCADDQAYFLALLELAGFHSKHIYRICYIYNYREQSEDRVNYERSQDCMRRIRKQHKYKPLAFLPRKN